MKLLIVSHTPHYQKEGGYSGWGPTVREINQLAKIFSTIVHLAPFHSEAPAPSSLSYDAPNIKLRLVPFSGGEKFIDKLRIIFYAPAYIKAMIEEMKNTDVVHVRCPASFSLIAIVLLACLSFPKKRWVKYAGNWKPAEQEAWSYRFQRWWLSKNFHRGVVTVNGEWPNQPEHVRSFLNPCLTQNELEDARAMAANKTLTQPIRFIFVGRLEDAKGVGRILEILNQLQQKGIHHSADFIGDGPNRAQYKAMAKKLNFPTHFHGWMPRAKLSQFYAKAHFVLMPSTASEGWPKVLSEAMAYGVVPITSDVSSIPYYLRNFGVGMSLNANDINAFVAAIESYVHQPERWKRESSAAIQSAKNFSYEKYLEKIQQLLGPNL